MRPTSPHLARVGPHMARTQLHKHMRFPVDIEKRYEHSSFCCRLLAERYAMRGYAKRAVGRWGQQRTNTIHSVAREDPEVWCRCRRGVRCHPLTGLTGGPNRRGSAQAGGRDHVGSGVDRGITRVVLAKRGENGETCCLQLSSAVGELQKARRRKEEDENHTTACTGSFVVRPVSIHRHLVTRQVIVTCPASLVARFLGTTAPQTTHTSTYTRWNRVERPA